MGGSGHAEGDRHQLPSPPKFIDGWRLPKKPDKVFYITLEPFEVSAQGPVRYQYFHLDPGFTEDKSIQGLEVRPGNRAVVHHIMVVAHPKRAHQRNFARGDQHLLSFVPGGVPLALPSGLARRFPKNYEFLFEVHYTPNGCVQKDHSRIGVIFADPKQVTHRVSWLSASNHEFTIPPGVEHHKVEADSPPMGRGVQLLRLYSGYHPAIPFRSGIGVRQVGMSPRRSALRLRLAVDLRTHPAQAVAQRDHSALHSLL